MEAIKSRLFKVLHRNEDIGALYDNLRNRFTDSLNNRQIKKDFFSRIKDLNKRNYIDKNNRPNINIIIITVDCLRCSNLSSHGYHRNTTPFLDSLNSNFKAISPSSFTYPSVPSILSGLYPHNHGAIIRGRIKNFYNLENFQSIRDNVVSFPELLYLLGYNIFFAATIDSAYYPFRNRILNSKLYPNTRCDKILNYLEKWILKINRPFFAYCHIGDIHEPLNPPKKFKHYFGKVPNLPNIKRWAYRRIEQQKGKKFEEFKKNKILLYDNTLRFVDFSIQNFFNYLEKQELLDSTIIIITADHGEEFWENGKLEAENFYDPRGIYGTDHGHNVFNEIIEVPIIISGPNIPKITSNGISTIDIIPTLIDLLKINTKLKFDGKNIFDGKEKRFLLTEAMGFGFEKKALTYGNFKLIYSKHDNVQWVFDLENDPMERKPIKNKEITSIFLNKLYQLKTIEEKMKIKKFIKNQVHN